ncbi:hypothetical protein RBH26_12285 [Natronolimnohabitans sp. A-GB9]|uniref:hypothetical protein n=1 Tax=Natronolimnohabitans sp. A-GB9 TaxID=3069757 RepID=UPI0027B7A1D2|nr:hypothetical protein [Natronolimnohabitans sp. A-GB9]MDQ2051257.1 hypothetical protein [Natronolimnohabitans sp. A-GB9]
MIQTLGAGGAIVLAGCLGGDEDDAAENGNGDDETNELASLEPTPEGEALSADDIETLVERFDDQPMSEEQHEVDGDERSYTPRHVWKWVTEDTLLFLHFDAPNVEEAENLIYFGIGVSGQFTADDIPAGQDEEFTHFHKHEAESWEAGHGGQDPDQYGHWLVHHATRDHEMDWGAVEVGIDREFMPTPPEE